jgi:hypothetical protein
MTAREPGRFVAYDIPFLADCGVDFHSIEPCCPYFQHNDGCYRRVAQLKRLPFAFVALC